MPLGVKIPELKKGFKTDKKAAWKRLKIGLSVG